MLCRLLTRLGVRAVIAAGVFGAACSLVDPLDDIRGGGDASVVGPHADGGDGEPRDGATDTGANAADSSSDVGKGPEGSSCAGTNEVEKNDDQATANAFPQGTICGSIDGNDVDVFVFTTAAAGVVQLTLSASEPLSYAGAAQGTNGSSSANSPLQLTLNNPGQVVITVARGNATSASVPYLLTRTAL
jgi:hypothetical protein